MTVSRDRKSLWRAGIVQILGLLVYVVAAELVVSALRPVISAGGLLPVGLALAIVPAVIWMAFFYAQDRREPEPRHYVLAVGFLGALLAAGIGQPLINNVFRVPAWIGQNHVIEILGSILVVGVTQEFLKYAAVRYSIYYSNEFDERIDGVIYGTAAGLGYATFLNIATVVNGGGISGDELGAGIIRIVVVALAQASLGGFTGYFIARTKFDDEPLWWMPAGLAIAAVLNGLFSWLRGEVTSSPLTISAAGLGAGGYNPWPALALAAALAAGLLAVTFFLMRRANQLTMSGADNDHQ
jgi:RsiW-degrading membrane proteinase PrsW (M82 family)